MFFSEWRAKRKFKYLGYLEGTVSRGPVWGLPGYTDLPAAVHFFENGYGERKVEGDSALTGYPPVEAWVNGAAMDPRITAHLQGASK